MLFIVVETLPNIYCNKFISTLIKEEWWSEAADSQRNSLSILKETNTWKIENLTTQISYKSSEGDQSKDKKHENYI